jgi:hypothetical protein
MNRRIAFLSLAVTILGACSSAPESDGAGGIGPEPDPAPEAYRTRPGGWPIVPPAHCLDSLVSLTWGTPAPAGPPSATFQSLTTCFASHCTALCYGSIYATPPAPVDGSPGSTDCKACLVTPPCQAIWNACVLDS